MHKVEKKDFLGLEFDRKKKKKPTEDNYWSDLKYMLKLVSLCKVIWKNSHMVRRGLELAEDKNISTSLGWLLEHKMMVRSDT